MNSFASPQSSRPRRVRTLVLAIASIAAIVTAALVGGATPAQAAYAGNPLLDSVSGSAVCDRTPSNRTISFHASIQLNSAMSAGAWVGFNFSFYEVDGYGRRIGPVYYHNGSAVATSPNGFANPVWMKTWTNSGGVIFNNPQPYYGGTVTWYPPLSGRVHVDVQVGVWNGSRYQLTNWIPVRYVNNFHNGLYWESYGGPDCLLRV